MTKEEQVGFDPKKSQVSKKKLADFIRLQLGGNLTEVPGVGDEAVKRLATGEGVERVTNTYQLIGMFLALRGPDKGDDHQVDTKEHCEKFWNWLKSKGINSNRSGIVTAIAEKVNIWIPGIYDEEACAVVNVD
ncbi:unnamed protein product [Pylaiella littoralis]